MHFVNLNYLYKRTYGNWMVLTSHRLINFLTLFLLISSATFSQQRDIEKTAEILFYKEDFPAALDAYREVVKRYPDDLIAQYHMEVCSLITKYPQKPLTKFLELGKILHEEDKFYNYWLGRVLFGQYEFEKAIEAWERFLEIQKYKSRIIINETNTFIENANRAMAFYMKPETHHAQRLPDIINTDYSEITPTYIDNLNELLYASSFESGSITHSEHPFHVFSSFFDGSNWTKPELQSSLGEYDANNANLEIIGNDGRLLMFKPNETGGLHESELKHDSIWTQPHLFDMHIKRSKLKPHFFVNEQETILIFSTKTGLISNLDLQYSVRAEGEWTKPRPFGNTINTNNNEESAFLASDGKTLYFSSDGHNSIGGYDIFKSVYDSISYQWSTPENMGFPINTINDELYFKLKPNGREGFFSSDRFHSTGGYDIYHFWEASYNLVRGKVIDASNNQPIKGAYVRFHPTQYLDTDFNGIADQSGTYETHIIPGDEYLVEVFLDHELIFQKSLTIKEEHDPNVIIESTTIRKSNFKKRIK
ncbi:MAG: hypothetical protein O2887_15635 [Bacteroidetes bacterium]|nr:hypothetical protein [Bacteroidota bacterium]